jgi:multiple sugar transport system permease protein
LTELAPASGARLRLHPRRGVGSPERGKWRRFAVAVVVTALTLAPLASVFLPAFARGRTASGGLPFGLDGIVGVLQSTPALTWLGNSLAVTLSTVVVAIVVGAPAGYALSRARGRLVSAYSLALFLLQSAPTILLLVPLFVLFATVGLVDSLVGLTLVYVGIAVSVAVWMLSAYFASIPVSLEEAAWLDGCSVVGGFVRIVLRNSLPGIAATAIFTFITAWNDYLIAVVFVHNENKLTLGIGLQMAHSPALILIIVLPPLVIFGLLNRHFSLGGISGALNGR